MSQFNYQMSDFVPFKDKEVCEQVRSIKKEDLCKHPNGNFKIRIIEDQIAFAFSFLTDVVAGIKKSLDEGRQHVIILPAPNPQYALVAQMLNELNISTKHVHTFNMDEYADEHGKTAPKTWKGGFQYWMHHDLFSRIKPELRMPDRQIHFPNTQNVNDYTKMIEDLGGADICYGGIGWCGHIGFFEPHLAEEFGEDIDAYLQAGSRIVDLHPITQCQNSLFADAGCAGDLSSCPPKAATIGPKDLANSKLVSFWDGFAYGDISWQRFITRLAAHGPVTPRVPASILQILKTQLTISGTVADDCITERGERRIAF